MLACEPGSVAATDVLMIGDNLFAGANRVGTALETAAREAGVLAADQALTDASSDANDALAYLGGGIATQYASGNSALNTSLVIMTGGGVDAVFGTCAEANAQCPVLVSAAQAAQDLLQQMTRDGVRYVVYAFYPDPADSGQKARIDALRSLIEPVCQSAPLTCFFLDLRPVFAGHTDSYVTSAGLTAQGATATADAIWATLESCLSH
jgi:hypothetical protein